MKLFAFNRTLPPPFDKVGKKVKTSSMYGSGTEAMETYTVRSTAKNGAAILLSMLPALAEDKEFHDALASFETEYTGGFADMNAATEYLAILCDNAYRRVKDESCGCSPRH